MVDLRLRTRIPDDELEEKKGKILTDEDYNILVTRDAFVRGPDGAPLAIFRKNAVPAELRDQAYPILHEFRNATTSNRGIASGSRRVSGGSQKRSYAREVPSAIVGAFDPSGPKAYCRLTSFTGTETEKMAELHPLLQFVGERMREEVADRWQAQMEYVERTQEDWVIPGTPFTTVTINNTWPTAVHTDKGDLDAGFSNLTVLRRGDYTGGVFCFPEFRIGFDLNDGDLILMDAHQWHGNTQIYCETCDEKLNGYHECADGFGGEGENKVERISVVAYYRTRMVECGTITDEAEKARVLNEQRANAAVGE